MHAEALAWVAARVGNLPTPALVVDLGGRDVNGSPRRLFGPATRYLAVDHLAGRGVDVVADAATVALREPCDLVLCLEVLEHTPRGGPILANARRLLRPGGTLLVTCAGLGRAPHSTLDGGAVRPGEWYANVAYERLRAWLAAAGFGDRAVEYHRERGDLYAEASA